MPNRLTYTMIARPDIKRLEDLRGKRFGVQAIGGSVWMGAILGLEHFGLDPRRDNINILSIGDQTVLAQAMETGTIDVTVLDGVFSRRLKQKGYSVIAELSESKIPYVSNVHCRNGSAGQDSRSARSTGGPSACRGHPRIRLNVI